MPYRELSGQGHRPRRVDTLVSPDRPPRARVPGRLRAYPPMWIRLWIPSIDIEGKVVQRGYTLVDPDPIMGTFSLDFVLHEPVGAAGFCAENAQQRGHGGGGLHPEAFRTQNRNLELRPGRGHFGAAGDQLAAPGDLERYQCDRDRWSGTSSGSTAIIITPRPTGSRGCRRAGPSIQSVKPLSGQIPCIVTGA